MKVNIILVSLALISLSFGRIKDNDVVVVRDKDKIYGEYETICNI